MQCGVLKTLGVLCFCRRAPCDFTIFFRELANVDTQMTPKEAYAVVARALSFSSLSNDEVGVLPFITPWLVICVYNFILQRTTLF